MLECFLLPIIWKEYNLGVKEDNFHTIQRVMRSSKIKDGVSQTSELSLVVDHTQKATKGNSTLADWTRCAPNVENAVRQPSLAASRRRTLLTSKHTNHTVWYMCTERPFHYTPLIDRFLLTETSILYRAK